MDSALEQQVRAGYDRREDAVRKFFNQEAERVARVCYDVAQKFHRGGRILAFGLGPAATDAQHVSVEFVHPVIVGKKALPAIALPNDSPTLLGLSAQDPASVFVRSLDMFGRADDIAIGISSSLADPGAAAVTAGLKQAASRGMLTIALSGPGSAVGAADPDWLFACEDKDPFIVQEVQETLYHILWELVHVFFDHRGLLEENPAGSRHDVGASSFLYPFLSATESGLDEVLEEVRGSVLLKAEEIIDVRSGQGDQPETLVSAAQAIAHRLAGGGKILAFGNGGSATDAQDFVTDLMLPPAGWRPLPALSLTNEEAVVTAVANDVGFDNVFSRQIIAYGEKGDVAVGISTSGGSQNHLSALAEAHRRGLLTVALVGYGGGETKTKSLADHLVVVGHDYIPRIQEAQASQYHILRGLLEAILCQGDI